MEKIKLDDYVKWIQGLYRKDHRKIDRTSVVEVVERCEHHPMYVQQFFFNLWDRSEPTIMDVDRVEQKIIVSRLAEYATAWDSFTLNQRRTLKLITATGGKNIYAADHLSRFGLRTPSQVKVATDKLIQREFLSKNGTYIIQDPLFKRWLQGHA